MGFLRLLAQEQSSVRSVRPQNLTQAYGHSRRWQHHGPAFTPSAQLDGVTDRRYPAVSGAPTAATTPQPAGKT